MCIDYPGQREPSNAMTLHKAADFANGVRSLPAQHQAAPTVATSV